MSSNAESVINYFTQYWVCSVCLSIPYLLKFLEAAAGLAVTVRPLVRMLSLLCYRQNIHAYSMRVLTELLDLSTALGPTRFLLSRSSDWAQLKRKCKLSGFVSLEYGQTSTLAKQSKLSSMCNWRNPASSSGTSRELKGLKFQLSSQTLHFGTGCLWHWWDIEVCQLSWQFPQSDA